MSWAIEVHICAVITLFCAFREPIGWVTRVAEWLGCPNGGSKSSSVSEMNQKLKVTLKVEISRQNGGGGEQGGM